MIIKTVDADSGLFYGLSMADFLEILRRRKMQLRKELNDVETAERVYLAAAARGEVLTGVAASANDLFNKMAMTAAQKAAQKAVDLAAESRFIPKTIQDMVIQLLDEIYPAGLTALEILDQIQRRWKPELMRTSLSPQLSRLHQQRSIKNDKHKWYLAVKNETGASEVSNAPA